MNETTGEILKAVQTLAARARYEIFWHTPYKTGNLAASAGDLDGGINEAGEFWAGFQIYDMNNRAAYGGMLNDCPTINHWVGSGSNKQLVPYVNRHYRWIDNFIEDFAARAPLYANVRRVL